MCVSSLLILSLNLGIPSSIRSQFMLCFLWILVMETTYQIQSKLNHWFVWFLIIVGKRSCVQSNFHLCSFGDHPTFNLSLFSHWDTSLCSFQTKLFVHWDTILRSISIYSLFIWFLIIRTLSQVLSQFILSSFGFSSLGHHPRYYLSLFFLQLVSHHRYTILGFISIYSLFLWFSSLVSHSRFYLRLIVCSLRLITLGSIYVSSLFISFLIIGTPSQVLCQFILCLFDLSLLG